MDQVPSAMPQPAKRPPWLIIAIVGVVLLCACGVCGAGVVALRLWDGGGPSGSHTEFCEVELLTAHEPSGEMNNTYVGMFVARTRQSEEVASSSYFEITPDEYSYSRAEETAERRAALESLVGRLESDGWERTGQGAEWYSVQLGR